MRQGQKDSKPILISAVILVSVTTFAYINSVLNTFTVVSLLYGVVALIGGIVHKLSGEWGIINMGIALFGVILVALWMSIEFIYNLGHITNDAKFVLQAFWNGFTGFMALGIAYVIFEFQISKEK